MKKIMILYASVGGGHFRAADGVRAYIEENYKDKYEVVMVDALKYTNKVLDKIVISSYINMARYSPKIWSKIYQMGEDHYTVANFSNAVQKILSKKLFTLFEEKQPDVVISTHPFITEMVACLKKKKKTNTKLAVILTDYASHRFWEMKPEFVNLYFVANEEMKYSLIHSGIDEKKIHVTGIPVRPEFLKQHNRKQIFEEFDLVEGKPVFLVFGGGAYGMSDASVLFKSLLDVDKDIQIIAIAGKSEKTKESFDRLALESDKKVVILGFTDKVPELMSIADFVVSKPGGLTTTEILVSNVPFVIFNPIPGQEEENSNFLTNNGAAVRLWDFNKATPLFEQLLNDSFKLEHIKIMQKHIAKPNSTKDIVDIVLKEIN